MVAATTLREALTNFTVATYEAAEALPTSDAILPPQDGISLFDAKNEIFLSYLQALALRNLAVLRRFRDSDNAQKAHQLSQEMTKRLVELRVYLERGVRPLEQKINFQVDRVVKAADDAHNVEKEKSRQTAGVDALSGADREDDGGNDGSDDDDDEDEYGSSSEDEIDQSTYRPNLSAMTSKRVTRPDKQTNKDSTSTVYRPPRIAATVMPANDRQERQERRPMRSKTLDEYIANEYSAAPVVEPSIGSNIAGGGRTNKSHRQIEDEQERRNFEETNLVRLPKQSKKELARKGYGRDKDGGFGGEEWRSLGLNLDRITDLTRRKGRESLADRSRKRMATEDAPRSDGRGDAFEIKKRRMVKKGK